jgi:hypothetical protein
MALSIKTLSTIARIARKKTRVKINDYSMNIAYNGLVRDKRPRGQYENSTSKNRSTYPLR